MTHSTETMAEKKRRPRRSKIALQREILDTVAELAGEEGFANINLSSISQAAGVDINAIQRNFGSLERLLDRYVQIFDYWYDDIVRNAKLSTSDEPEQLYGEILKKIIESLYKNKNMRQLLLWEMTEENNTTKRVAYNREHVFKDVLSNYEEVFKNSDLDIEVLTSIFVAGINDLIIRRKKSFFLGVDYSLTKNKERLIKTVADIVSMCFATLKQRQEITMAAKKLKEKGVDTAIIADCLHIEKEVVEEL